MIYGRFAVDALLDQDDAAGRVFRATDTASGQPVALWVLPDGLAARGDRLAALRSEFLRVRELSHPGVTRVLELGQDGDTVFVTSEFVDGETLRNVLNGLHPERLDVGEADQVIAAVGEALGYAHDRGVVHGDVRAENVVVTTNHRFKLSNFLRDSAHRAGVTGPEAFEPTPADDVHQLASMAYELYSGRPCSPVLGPERIEGLTRRRSKALKAALSASGPAFSNAREFLALAGLTGTAPSVEPAPVAPPPWQPARRPPGTQRVWPVALMATGVAAIAVTLVSSNEQLRALTDAVPVAQWIDGLRSSLPGNELAEAPPEAGEPADEEAPARGADFAIRELGASGRAMGAPLTSGDPQAQEGTVEPAAESATAAAPSATGPPGVSAATDSAAPEGADGAAAEMPGAAGEGSGNAAAPALPVVSLSRGALTVYESETAARIDVVRTGNTETELNVIWWTTDGTAREDEDYVSFGRRLQRLDASDTRATLYIPIVCDTHPKNEYFHVHLDTDPDVARVGDISRATVTILGDDC